MKWWLYLFAALQRPNLKKCQCTGNQLHWYLFLHTWNSMKLYPIWHKSTGKMKTLTARTLRKCWPLLKQLITAIYIVQILDMKGQPGDPEHPNNCHQLVLVSLLSYPENIASRSAHELLSTDQSFKLTVSMAIWLISFNWLSRFIVK